MPRIKVLVVDDHTIVRDGICALLGLSDDIEIVGEASNGREALEVISSLKPDVVLMDVAMPVMGGLEATRRIRKQFPDVKVMILTQYDDKEYVIPIIEAGASGFISKSAVSSELASGIRSLSMPPMASANSNWLVCKIISSLLMRASINYFSRQLGYR